MKWYVGADGGGTKTAFAISVADGVPNQIETALYTLRVDCRQFENAIIIKLENLITIIAESSDCETALVSKVVDAFLDTIIGAVKTHGRVELRADFGDFVVRLKGSLHSATNIIFKRWSEWSPSRQRQIETVAQARRHGLLRRAEQTMLYSSN